MNTDPRDEVERITSGLTSRIAALAIENAALREKLEAAQAKRVAAQGRYLTAVDQLTAERAALTTARAEGAAAGWLAGRDAAGLLLEKRDYYGLADDVYCVLTPPADLTAALDRVKDETWNETLEALASISVKIRPLSAEDLRALKRPTPRNGEDG